MASLLPAAVYGLTVPNGDVMIPAISAFPGAFRITMAAIDPSAEPEYSGTAIDGATPRATLKIIRHPMDPDDDSEDFSDEEEAQLKALLNESDSEEDSSDDEEINGGPSDPSKSKRARKEAALKQLKAAFEDGDQEDEGPMMSGANGEPKKLDKGKEKATGDESESSDDDDDSEDLTEEFVLCTLDTTQHYQQPLNITVAEGERIFFKVSGTHAIHLTGNYVVPVDDGSRDEDDEDYGDEEDEMDYPPYGMGDESDLSDELDDLENPRIAEIDTDDDGEEAPQLVKAKGKNKRPAPESEDDAPGLDDIMAKSLKGPEPSTNGEPKLSKKQLKKLKNNAGKAAAAATASNEAPNGKKDSESPSVKKVQFAKDLEQGPSASKSDPKESAPTDKKADNKAKGPTKPSLGLKEVQGVKIDDKKLGSGPLAKKGNRVSMRYIGKLNDGKVFDSNKKGKPFSFKLGAGEVIKGWEIGTENISVGGERRIKIPARLAYGSKSMPGIPANSELTFDVKCLEIK